MIVIFLAALFCGSFVFLFTYFQSRQQVAAQESKIGKEIPLPDVSFTTLNGDRLAEDQIRARKVILMFVTTDCQYCESEATFVS